VRRAIGVVADAVFDFLPAALLIALLCVPAPFVVQFA
jgi:hypothetical protein